MSDNQNDVALVASIRKVNKTKRLVTAITNRTARADGTPYVDHDGDVIDIDNLEDVFISSFFDEGVAKGGAGWMHKVGGLGDIVMWFTVNRDERETLGLGPGDEMGLVKFRVRDDELWRRIESGELTEVSIEGTGTREPI